MIQLIKRVERPRELTWFQAGAMLYGDWGTSKAYVLGLAFALAGHASWFFLGLMACLSLLIGMCYMIVCRIYTDGGGVYSSLRNRSRTLAVIGGLFLIADYVITASLTTLSAFHYFNVANPQMAAIISILVIGVINMLGPSKSGNIAAVIAVIASLSAVALFSFTLPHVKHLDLSWPTGNLKENWTLFVGMVLALSGVEAVANMTGIMKQPVAKTARLAILPVVLEVAFLTFLLGIAMNAVPGLMGHTEDMLRALGTHYIGPFFGEFISLAFGALLLSAANTAVNDLVSIQFAMAKDRELPGIFTRLNRFGMPWVALTLAVGVPVLMLLVVPDILQLAALYAIGVVGAIMINLGALAYNFKIDIRPVERATLLVGSFILFLIEVTIAYQKQSALLFVSLVVGVGFLLRLVAKRKQTVRQPAQVPNAQVLTVAEAKEIRSLYLSSFMIAMKQLNINLLDEAVLRIKSKGENSVYLCYIEEAPLSQDAVIEVEPSADSLELLSQAEKELEARGINVIPVWHIGERPGRQIAYVARELGVKTVLMGVTQRSALVNFLRGDVFSVLARHLSKECKLLIVG